MTGPNWAALDRQEIARLMWEVGPDQPTLCGEWTTHDLAAHLVLREARPDAAFGIAFSPASGWTDRVQSEYEKRGYEELVDAFSEGPPVLSVFRLPGSDRMLNTAEHFVHLEDIRRAQPEWKPRDLPQAYRDTLWSIIKKRSRMLLRHSDVGIDVVRTDDSTGQTRFTAIRKQPLVTIIGPAQEILLFAYGRKDQCELKFEGDPADIKRLMGADFSV